jgi:hypothetical protein
MIKDSDLAGFNSDRFDIPLLAEELLRAGVDFDMKSRVSVDVQTIFHINGRANFECSIKILLRTKFRKCAFRCRSRYNGNLRNS